MKADPPSSRPRAQTAAGRARSGRPPSGGQPCDTKDPSPTAQLPVADQIQRDLAELIRELKDPRIGMVTINAVEVSPTTRTPGVLRCWWGDPRSAEEALNEAAGYLRNGLFKRLQIHTVPTLHFHFDRTTERAAEVECLIRTRANATRAKDDDCEAARA